MLTLVTTIFDTCSSSKKTSASPGFFYFSENWKWWIVKGRWISERANCVEVDQQNRSILTARPRAFSRGRFGVMKVSRCIAFGPQLLPYNAFLCFISAPNNETPMDQFTWRSICGILTSSQIHQQRDADLVHHAKICSRVFNCNTVEVLYTSGLLGAVHILLG